MRYAAGSIRVEKKNKKILRCIQKLGLTQGRRAVVGLAKKKNPRRSEKIGLALGRRTVVCVVRLEAG